MKQSPRMNILMLLAALLIVAPVFCQNSKPPTMTKELTDLGKKSFEQNCAVCHGLKGDANTPAGNALTPRPPDFTKALKDWPDSKGDPGKIFDLITKGIPDSAMMGWSQLSEKERWGLVYYIMEFSKEK
jgi:mono/diheme cytochrome c family protein